MATEELPPVNEETLHAVLAELRTLRLWAVVNRADPWAFRQAMITIMAIDTHVALERGIEVKTLAAFDVAAKEKAREFIKSIPEEAPLHGR